MEKQRKSSEKFKLPKASIAQTKHNIDEFEILLDTLKKGSPEFRDEDRLPLRKSSIYHPHRNDFSDLLKFLNHFMHELSLITENRVPELQYYTETDFYREMFHYNALEIINKNQENIDIFMRHYITENDDKLVDLYRVRGRVDKEFYYKVLSHNCHVYARFLEKVKKLIGKNLDK